MPQYVRTTLRLCVVCGGRVRCPHPSANTCRPDCTAKRDRKSWRPPMTAFVIVRQPPDEPERFVVRRWFGVPGALVRGEVVGESKTLDGARSFVPTDKENLGRQPTDDPCVEETWV